MERGRIIADRFEIVDLAGRGGMGAVYRARDLLDGGDVALKVLHAIKSGSEDRFSREAKALATLSHPALARYVAHGSTPEGERYLAMEWFEGLELSQRLRVGQMPLPEVITLGTRIAGALAVAHTHGIVHRDVKPSNILLADGAVEHVKLIDFGVARLSRFGTMTRTGQAVGTPRYMAPEQARGDKAIDARTDVFSLGCVLFACLTGRPAFTGLDARAVLAKILLEEAPRVSELCPDLPPAVDELIARMLSKKPELRPSNCETVAHMLQAIGDVDQLTVDGASARQLGLGYREQRLTCLVLVASPTLSDTEPQAVSTIGGLSGPAPELRAAVRAHGGRVDQLADGSCIATLPETDSPKAQATRAARCALAMRGILPDARMALATVRRDVSDRTSLGEMIDRAAEVLASDTVTGEAFPATAAIRVDPMSADLLEERFDIVRRGDWLELRGEKDPVDITRTLLGKPSRCVGRTRELGILNAIFDDCVEESAPRAVLITGAPGMGKSRIRYEFLRRLQARGEPVEILIGRGDPMRAGAAFGLIAPAIRRAARVLDGEDEAMRRRKLAARIGRHLSDDEEQARITEFLGELVGVPFSDEGRVQLRAARHDASVKGEQMRRAWEDWLAAECDAQPVVLVLEDLHWGDWPTAKLVDRALRNLSEKPFMVLALARPDIEAMFPNLWEGRGVMEIELTPLSRRASEKLVREALGADVEDEIVERVAEQAAGNAFFLEELIRVTAEGKSDALPDSVLAIVQARLDRLPPEARLILRAASVFGSTFWARGLATLVAGELETGELDDWLSYLVDRELITLRIERKFPAEDEYRFRHAFVREAAYAMITDADKRAGHRLAAAWLEEAGEIEAIVLAEHHERGDEPEQAAGLYRRACEQALEGSDHNIAIARARRGLECLERGESDDPALAGALRLLQGRALRWKGIFGDAQRLCLEALEGLERASELWCEAAAEAANSSASLSDHDRLIAIANELIELGAAGADDRAYVMAAASTASQLLFAGRYPLAGKLLELIDHKTSAFADDEPQVAAAIYRVLGVRAICTGDLAAGLDNKAASVMAYDQAGDRAMAQQQRGNLGSVYINLGAYAEAEELLTEAVKKADAMGLPSVASLCRLNLAAAYAFQDKLDQAKETLEQSLDGFEGINEVRMSAIAHADMSFVLLREDDLTGAEAEARLGVEMSEGTPPSKAYALAKLAEVLLAAGRGNEALQATREAMRILEETGGLDEGEALVRLLYAESLLATGDEAAGREAIEVAHARLQEVGGKISDPRWRNSYFTKVPENRRTTELFAELVGSA